ncbi:MAG: putative selenium-dependent hydroxylase accessory protein YqeC [Mogibacterium sp.]|nr:putative selenium-dependent hydroxylase accessory protein YqeC [Mogibacterium sp.]
MDLSNLKGKQNTITEALQLGIPEHAVISLTGAGGKTSLMFGWAKELASEGRKVAITTTTHMLSPERMKEETSDLYQGIDVFCCDGTETAGQIDEAIAESDILFVFSPCEERPSRVTAPPDEVLEHLYDTADVTLIEADGSRRMPIKWPASYEPVVPDRTDITVYVVGLSAVNQKTDEVMFRVKDFPKALWRDTVDVNLLHKLISSKDGGRKGACGDFRVFLNQVDNNIDRLAVSYRLQQILSVMGIQTAWGSLLDQGSNDKASEPAPDADIEIAVILEAAGNSTRFGSNKLLHIMEDGRPMASCVMDAVCEAEDMLLRSRQSGIKGIRKILVTQYEEVAALAPDFDTVMNSRPDLGISHSMQLGIKAAGDADAYMFCVCDQPFIRPESICRLIDEYKKGTAGIVSLSWKGEMCNPKIFSSRYRQELMSLSGDIGGRQIIAEHADDLSLMEAGSEAEVKDIDS